MKALSRADEVEVLGEAILDLSLGRSPSIYHPYGGYSEWLTIHPLKPADTEKVTINLGHVDLGRIDLLVQEGFYSNRTDFIRTAIRNQLTAQGDAVAKSIDRHMLELGLRDISRAELEAAREAGETLHIKVVGLARIAPECLRRTRKSHDRLDQGSWRPASAGRDQGRPQRPHQLTRRHGKPEDRNKQ